MAKQLRLVVLGDPHICERDRGLWEQAVGDLNELSPDAVLVVGDLTGHPGTGTPAGMRYAIKLLDEFNAPWHTVIGNHDLQATCFDTDEQAVASFVEHVRRETPWFRADIGPITVLGLSNTQWRQNAHCSNELVYNEAQLDWAADQLDQVSDRPVFILAHVAPIGSGIITMAELHAGVGNAYANQNHVPHRVMKLVNDHPNVLMWFSGHNHQGQHYRDTITMRLGVHFVHAGVIGRHTRDGYRHSRVIDVHDDHLLVQTFDHTRRRLDDSLTYREPHSLDDLLAYRRRNHGRRMVPRDPRTMRQGPDADMPHRGRRFVWLSDAHLVDTITDCQRRVLEWGLQQAIAAGVDEQILGGDLTHHASLEQAKHFLGYAGAIPGPIRFLPGNNETADLPLEDDARITFVRSVQRLENWPGYAFALATTAADDAHAAVSALAQQLPQTGHALVLAHFPPESTGDAVRLLDRPGLYVEWICGHRHMGETYDLGNIRVHVCGGLDPVKVRGHTPELFIGDWDGTQTHLRRLRAPIDLLMPHRGITNPFGLAYRGTPEELLETAMAEHVRAVQFRAADIRQQPSPRTLELVQAFRERYEDGFLSLHLPNLSPEPAGLNIASLEEMLNWAAAVRIDDLTIHLPNTMAADLFTGERIFADTDWAKQCIDTYQALAERAVAMGMQLSIENVYHSERVPPEREKLGTRPWHLLAMVEELRRRLRAGGCAEGQVERIGVIFDTGHAFRDPVVAKEHGLGDWIMRLSPYLQLAHIHQTIHVDGKLQNHRAITDACGPRINYTGVLPIIEEQVSRRVPLLLEVRRREEALTSLRVLRRMIAAPGTTEPESPPHDHPVRPDRTAASALTAP